MVPGNQIKSCDNPCHGPLSFFPVLFLVIVAVVVVVVSLVLPLLLSEPHILFPSILSSLSLSSNFYNAFSTKKIQTI